MGISKLPPELHDYILDFLHDDVFSLKACSLTCRTWFPASQYHIFYRISLPSSYFCAAFGHLLQRSPHIGSIVREFSMSSIGMRVSPGFEDPRKSEDSKAELSPATFSCLTSVKRLEILVLTIDPALQMNLLQNFRSVSSLALHYCHFPTFGDFVQLVQSFPDLEILTMRGITWDQAAYVAPPRNSQTPNLKRLSLGRDLNVSPIVEWILAEGVHHQLEEFSACCSSEKDATTYGTLARALGPSLRRCEFDWYSSKLNDVLSLPNEFTLDQCTSLESLHLRCPVLYHQSLPWVTSLLSRINSAFIETVSIEIRLLGDLDAIDWECMNQVFGTPSFRNLKPVIFKILVWPTATSWSDDVEASVRSRLPQLDSRGMIRFLP